MVCNWLTSFILLLPWLIDKKSLICCCSLESSTMINQSDNYSYYYYNETEPRTHLNNSLDLVYTVLTFILAIVGLFFNACTITIIIRGDNFGKGIKIQLMNLAVADVLCSLASVTAEISDSVEGLPMLHKLNFCRMLQMLNPIVFLGSLLSNTAISLERFVAVYFPLKMKEYRRRHVITVTVAVWILPVLMNLQRLFTSDVYFRDYFSPDEFACLSEIYLPPSTVRIALYVGFVCLPVLIIITCYTLICIKLKRRKVIGEQHRSNHSSVNIQVNKTLLLCYKLK